MPHRSRNNQWTFLLKFPTPSSSKQSFFFVDCELPSLTTRRLENSVGEQPKKFEEAIKEEERILPTHTIVENKKNEIFAIK